MSYQVLARKWRPTTFSELVGQQQTSQTLINALESQRLHHAYLFTGTRGVGKTTIARILSKSLNCETGITATPCNKCSSCLEISQGSFVDLLEIDAASKTKVEDTRELLDNVQYRPTRGRYKIYLIDEVHMLSGHSFNALLKTLEEPPPHVIFLLATTDPQKLPVTVLSRCLQFHLRRIDESEIVSHLESILNSESIEYEKEALQVIAKGADGSMRDALSLLDQAIIFSGEKISQLSTLNMLGNIDPSHTFDLLNAVCANDVSRLMQVIQQIADYSPDYDELLSDWLSLLHRIAVEQATQSGEDAQISQLATQISQADLQLYYQLSLHARRDLAYAPHPRQGFEMAMLRIVAFKPQQPGEPVKKKTKRTESVITDSLTADPVTKSPATTNSVITSPTAGVTTSSVVSDYSKTDSVSKTQNNTQIEPSMSQLTSEPQPTFKSQQITAQQTAPQLAVDNLAKPSRIDEPQVNQQAQLQAKPDLRLVEALNKQDEDKNNQACEEPSKTLSNQSVAPIELSSVNASNWHIVVGQLAFQGHGKQALLNAIGEYANQKLMIKHLAQTDSLLTDRTKHSIEAALKDYFSNSNLKIVYQLVEQLDETPRQKQIKLQQAMLAEAKEKLLTDSQVNKLIEELNASLVVDSIKINEMNTKNS